MRACFSVQNDFVTFRVANAYRLRDAPRRFLNGRVEVTAALGDATQDRRYFLLTLSSLIILLILPSSLMYSELQVRELCGHDRIDRRFIGLIVEERGWPTDIATERR